MTKRADICLIVEGAYPYVTGGVSSWIQALVTNLPEHTFSVLHIGAQADPQRKMRYTLPKNVVAFHEIFLNRTDQLRRRKGIRLTAELRQEFQMLHEAIAIGKSYDQIQIQKLLQRPGLAGLHAGDLFNDRRCWEMLVNFYTSHAADESFVDFF